MRPLRIVVLLKQVPRLGDLALGEDGRLRREGTANELDPYCRRALAQGVSMATASGGTCVVVTMGPPGAEDVVREALAYGSQSGVLVSDPGLAGSDSLVTARALAAAVRSTGPFDLVLTGLHSVDSGTGQLAPELAELLALPFVEGVRELDLVDGRLTLGCERDDGWTEVAVSLPAVLSVAERLCAPAKVDPSRWPPLASDRVRRIGLERLGPGPWGSDGSPTRVGATRVPAFDRGRYRTVGTEAGQVREAVAMLGVSGVLEALFGPSSGPGWEVAGRPPGRSHPTGSPPRRTQPAKPGTAGLVPEPPAPGGSEPESPGAAGSSVAVLVEPDRPWPTGELLAAATQLAGAGGGGVAALVAGAAEVGALVGSGAGRIVEFRDAAGSVPDEEQFASAVAAWVTAECPPVLLAPGTSWGRHVAGRVAARLGIGLIGDAVDLELDGGQLVAWKPAFDGRVVAAVTTHSPVQLATVAPGAVTPAPRPPAGGLRPRVATVTVAGAGRVVVTGRSRDPEADLVQRATALVAVGQGVHPALYGELDPLLGLLGAELVGTRKVTDRGWLPKTRQIGVTGSAVRPVLYVAIGLSGSVNHMVGVRRARAVLALNSDPSAPVFDGADIGVTGDWRRVVPLLAAELAAWLAARGNLSNPALTTGPAGFTIEN